MYKRQVEVNAETDFVAKNDQFIEFVKDVCYVVGKWGPVDMDTLMTLPYRKTGLTVQQMLQEKVLVIGENIKIRRFVRYDSGVSVAYNHMNGRIGVLLNMEVSAGLEQNEKVLELGKDLAMQLSLIHIFPPAVPPPPWRHCDRSRSVQRKNPGTRRPFPAAERAKSSP